MDPLQAHLTFASTDLRRSRVTTFFRGLMLFPHFFVLGFYGIGAGIVFLGQWLSAIFTGKTPEGTYAFLAKFYNYQSRVSAYALYLTDDYPPFNGTDPYVVNLVLPNP